METAEKNKILQQTFNLLKYTFVILPIAAGLDKFSNLLTNWEHYLNPAIAGLLPFPQTTFMMIVGVIEIIAGIIVFKKPEIGGNIVAAWLMLIAITLLTYLNYLDVAVRDVVMAISAFAMAQLAKIVNQK
ncbi:MAG TPA: hypothetical protein PKN14_03680 [Bacteroidia bacterium]|nr:MAG: tRNA (5-methylaminomethyl-2-thiouridylate)-methyltransferase [Bacteroidetes bacterium OLB10]MBE7511135.1 hypothetical protein [Bacteroidia bacterium]MBX3105553.1 hypothetical protein [Bacteroidota bacterium]MCE7954889.1 hypothetical protein [Bacteroidetes bacterium CHB6]OQB63896.1 MAG: hypothetical protein BWX95_00927 [Bacteroidetes bacterium ADurb.Bin141]